MAGEGINIGPAEYLTVEAAAQQTGRSEEMIRRYIRKGIVDSIPDPTDGRRRLIALDELSKVIRQPMRGKRLKSVAITKGDGTVIHRIIPVSIE